MATFKYLSDEDLRKKLKEHGINSPVTASTRDILIKRLNHITCNSNKNSPTTRRNSSSSRNIGSLLHTFSSDEEEEEESFTNKSSRVTRSKRSTRGNNDSSWFNNNSLFAGDDNLLNKTDINGRATRRNNLSSLTKYKKDDRHAPLPLTNTSKASDLKEGKVSYRRQVETRDTGSHLYRRFSPRSDVSLHTRIHDNYDTGSDSDVPGEDITDSLGRTRQRWSREPDMNSSLNSRHIHQNSTSGFDADRSATGQRQDYSFSRNRRDVYADGHVYEDGEPDRNTSFTAVTDSIINQVTPPDPPSGSSWWSSLKAILNCIQPSYGTSDDSSLLQSVPLVLLTLLAVFFLIVGLCYLNIRIPLHSIPIMLQTSLSRMVVPFLSEQEGDTSISSDIKPQAGNIPPDTLLTAQSTNGSPGENLFPVCSTNITENCVTVSQMVWIPTILGLLDKVLLPALSEQAGLYQCGEAEHCYLTPDEMVAVLSSHVDSKIRGQLHHSVQGLITLVTLNPHWGMEALKDEATGELLGLSPSVHPVRIFCHIRTALYNLAYAFLALVCGALVAWLMFTCFRYIKKKEQETEQKVFEMVENILELLAFKCGAGGEEFIAVNHVRDSLIPPRVRYENRHIWEKAVQFIDKHDSRVFREVRCVGGEDCEVWRWIPGAPRSPAGSGRSPVPEKTWQGEAFESLEKTHNLPLVSPTSCLKIRNMFDCDVEFGDDWAKQIQDSLLEKCEGVKVVHMAVDRASKEGCVYVKCSCPDEAGKAFRALHGCWYDGNLITVKYLRDERYHERFPSAKNATNPLQPSNNKRLSLQSPSATTRRS